MKRLSFNSIFGCCFNRRFCTANVLAAAVFVASFGVSLPPSLGISVSADEAPGGIVVAWGSNDAGESEAPPDLTNDVAITAGWSHSLALRIDGRVVGWGDESYTESSALSTESNIVAIAAGDRFSVGLRRDGTPVARGDVNAAPPEATNGIGIAAGPSYALLLQAGGSHSRGIGSTRRKCRIL